jgi:small subunit ribosomal protein S8
MVIDPIADMLTRIRNAQYARHERTVMPASKVKKLVAQILKQEGYVADVRDTEDEKGHKALEIVLKYGRDKRPAIDGIRRVSKPGRRVYVRHDKIPHVVNGLGISILSTSSGVMSDTDARRSKVGGELLCEVW